MTSAVEVVGRDRAQEKADKSLIEAEKYKAALVTPGESFDKHNTIGHGISDDDFFHLTCHIDPNLIQKIEAGEFVDLDKLLPKDKLSGTGSSVSDDNRLEWVNRDGGTFLVPAQKESKLIALDVGNKHSGSIYCGANPERAKEIWQYISFINTAANAYYWDNVYNYDITFRHLMAFNPARSWAVTYNQMWNLSMKDPLPRGNHGNGRSYGMVDHFTDSGRAAGKIKSKSDYCWNFNKGVKCKFGSKCRFIERCSYCDSPSHAVIHCPKLQKKNGGSLPGHSKSSHRRSSGASRSTSNGGRSDSNSGSSGGHSNNWILIYQFNCLILLIYFLYLFVFLFR